MKFRPSLGRLLWAYPLAVCANILLLYNTSDSDQGFLPMLGNAASVIFIIAGAIFIYSLMFTTYEIGENALIIRYGLNSPLKLPYHMIFSAKPVQPGEELDIMGSLRAVLSLKAVEIRYHSGKRKGAVVVIAPNDTATFIHELESRIVADEYDVRRLQVEV
ncbi:MAG: PH domain-containing protein [Defluviitaleaceae bacterium]|nr:PH domain-containing protein [Defluviitaleaceae bacterium]